MTSEEYVDYVKLMMDKQDMYLMWFIGIFSVVLFFVGILQWRLSSNQIKKITTDAKEDARKEVIEELIKNYGLAKVTYIDERVKLLVQDVDSLKSDLSSTLKARNYEEKLSLSRDIRNISLSESSFFELFDVISVHYPYIIEKEENLDGLIDLIFQNRIIDNVRIKQTKSGYDSLIATIELFKKLYQTDRLDEFENAITIKYYEFENEEA
ncbi:hypothetical protein CI088_00250 [Enterococcus plantarum]|uniref:Uncharacterized protein n=1 Tax=Enterococcus plantarum TaxID=1077675 RepID=A0A2W4BLV8_9ENTE|nr:hypothetical protein [Enterococcus plantarum]PZL78235.1 hypothetical protein CI088_00250 [Enterococcus plantarum]